MSSIKIWDDENTFAIICWFNDFCKCVCWTFTDIWSNLTKILWFEVDLFWWWRRLNDDDVDCEYVDDNDSIAMSILEIYDLIEEENYKHDVCFATCYWFERFDFSTWK